MNGEDKLKDKQAQLLPCPFCGKKPNLDDSDTLYPSGIYWRDDPEIGVRTYHTRDDSKEGDGACYDMHCPTPSGGCGAMVSGDSREEAIEVWNTRAPSPLHNIVTEFVNAHQISCPESIYQRDSVIENAYELIEKLINVVGYYSNGTSDTDSDD